MSQHDAHTYTLGIGILAIVIAVVLLSMGAFAPTSAPTEGEPQGFVPQNGKIPPLTPQIEAMLEKSDGFSLLVSYTDNGFEPKNALIQKGDTVRFTNNSSSNVWIAASGEKGSVYPGVVNGCGSSALDTCRALAPLEFWEFTFSSAGSWNYQNNLQKDHSAVIRVR